MWSSNYSTAPSKHEEPSAEQASKKKLRAACDRCHQAKTKCSGGSPCQSCAAARLSEQCQYSFTTRTGRPKGAKNKKTLAQAQGKSKHQVESDSSHDHISPAESSNSGSLRQAQVAGPYSSTSQLSLMEQGLMDLDNLFLDASSDSLSESLSFSVHSSSLSDVLEYDPGAILQQNRAFLSNVSIASDPMETQQSIFTSPTEHSQPFPFRTQSSLASSSPALQPQGAVGAIPGVGGYGSYLGSTSVASEDTFLNPRLLGMNPPPLPRTSSTSSMRAMDRHGSTCTCVQQHSELLRHLRGLEHSQNTFKIDNVLTSIQQALEPWQNLINCPFCLHRDEFSVLLSALTSIRVILSHLKQICFGTTSQSSGYTAPEPTAPAYSPVVAGDYHPTRNEQRHIMDLLIFHALRKIKFALHALNRKFVQSRSQRGSELGGSLLTTGQSGQTSPIEGDTEVGSIHAVFENLDRSVNTFVNAIRARNSKGSPRPRQESAGGA